MPLPEFMPPTLRSSERSRPTMSMLIIMVILSPGIVGCSTNQREPRRPLSSAVKPRNRMLRASFGASLPP